MQKGFITLAVLLIVGTLLVGVPLAAWYTATPEPQVAEEAAVGGFNDQFLSIQIASGTPVSGYIPQTDGTNSFWVSTSSLGILGGSSGATTLDGLTDVTITSSSTGNILYLNGSGQWVNLATGSDGQVLKLASGIPSWDTDNTAAGGSGLGSTTPWTAGQLAVVATDGLVKSIATSTLSENISGLEFDANPWIVGSARTLSLSSGYVIPLSASTTEWSLAYASTTALTPSYIRGLFSNTATGLTYNSSTGATSLTSGYNIPLTASTTEWHNFHTTPSGRITAGTGIDWSGNTLNGVYTAGDGLTLTGEDFDFDGGATPSGDLGGTWASPSVTDDSHAHTGTTLSGIDVSSDTNLTVTATGLELSADAIALTTGYVIPLSASTTEWTNFYNTPSTRITDGTGLTWSANTLNVDDVYVLNTGDSISGNLTFSGTGANIALGSNYLSGDGDDEGIYVSSTGNVGIGTTNPDYLLSVDNASGDSSVRINASNGNDAYLRLTEEASSDFGGMLKYDGNSNVFQIGTLDTGSEVPAIYIPRNSGNVGIGTSTPTSKLHVIGTAGTGNILTIASSTYASLLTFTATGRLGIGTTTPATPVSIVGTTTISNGSNGLRIIPGATTTLEFF